MVVVPSILGDFGHFMAVNCNIPFLTIIIPSLCLKILQKELSDDYTLRGSYVVLRYFLRNSDSSWRF